MAPRICVFILSCLLAACGGGGGDSGGGTGNGNPAPTSFSLSELTALEAGSYALGALEEALLSAVTTTVVGLEFAQGGPPRQDLCGGEPISKAYDDRDGSGTLTEGDTVRFHHPECFGLARNYALTRSAFNPSGGAYGVRT